MAFRARRVFLIILGVFTLIQSAPAHAAPKLQGTYSDWSAYTRTDGGETICYVVSKPQSKSPTNVKHGDVYFMIANWKSGVATEQPSFRVGYSLKSSTPPKIMIRGAKFNMYVSQNEGFVQDRGDEQNLLKAMRAGSTMRVSAMSTRGTAVAYSYSLKGVTAALKKAKTLCK